MFRCLNQCNHQSSGAVGLQLLWCCIELTLTLPTEVGIPGFMRGHREHSTLCLASLSIAIVDVRLGKGDFRAGIVQLCLCLGRALMSLCPLLTHFELVPRLCKYGQPRSSTLWSWDPGSVFSIYITTVVWWQPAGRPPYSCVSSCPGPQLCPHSMRGTEWRF